MTDQESGPVSLTTLVIAITAGLAVAALVIFSGGGGRGSHEPEQTSVTAPATPREQAARTVACRTWVISRPVVADSAAQDVAITAEAAMRRTGAARTDYLVDSLPLPAILDDLSEGVTALRDAALTPDLSSTDFAAFRAANDALSDLRANVDPAQPNRDQISVLHIDRVAVPDHDQATAVLEDMCQEATYR